MPRTTRVMTAATVPQRQGRPIRREGAKHLFTVGQAVRLRSEFRRPFLPAGIYHIAATLPPTGGSLQYRIRSDVECYERVTTQETLEAVPASADSATLLGETFGGAPKGATQEDAEAADLDSATKEGRR